MSLVDGMRQDVKGAGRGLVKTRLMQTLLYQVQPGDPVTFVSVPLALMAAATIASAIPAVRATRVSPARALRMD